MNGRMNNMSPETKRRLKVFLRNKWAVLSLVFVSGLFGLSLVSEWVSNSKPVIAKVGDRLIFPAYLDYNWADMGRPGAGVVDYRDLKSEMTFAWWPLLSWDPYENDDSLEALMSPPSASHPLGTDVSGRDVFARLLYGTRISFLFAFSCWVITYIFGIFIGLAQGFFGCWIDLIGQRIVEIFSSIPVLYLLLLLISMVNPNIWFLIAITSMFGWISISQYMRAQALKNRSLAYTEAAAALGASWSRQVFRHILPNSLVPIVTFSPFAIVGFIAALSSLDFLGFGVPAPTPSWGELFDQARANFQTAWWLAFFPSLLVFLTVVTLNFVGEALRESFDPRS
jgi:microcin C transport system permease protein